MPSVTNSGIPFEGRPGPFNAITDVRGVTVGHTTLSSGHGPLKVGDGPVRTGVTAVLPRKSYDPVFAGWCALNGNGEMTGINGNTIYALPHQRLTEALRKYNRLVE